MGETTQVRTYFLSLSFSLYYSTFLLLYFSHVFSHPISFPTYSSFTILLVLSFSSFSPLYWSISNYFPIPRLLFISHPSPLISLPNCFSPHFYLSEAVAVCVFLLQIHSRCLSWCPDINVVMLWCCCCVYFVISPLLLFIRVYIEDILFDRLRWIL